MTVRTATPAYLSYARSLQNAGLELGKTDGPVGEQEAAIQLLRDGYMDVHVGNTVDERLTLRQVREVDAIQNHRLDGLSPASRQLLSDMREIERHRQRFVYLNGQANTLSGFPAGGQYHAYYQTTVPLPLALAEIDDGFPTQTGLWGYQPALGLATPSQKDGPVDRYVDEAYLTPAYAHSLAETMRGAHA